MADYVMVDMVAEAATGQRRRRKRRSAPSSARTATTGSDPPLAGGAPAQRHSAAEMNSREQPRRRCRKLPCSRPAREPDAASARPRSLRLQALPRPRLFMLPAAVLLLRLPDLSARARRLARLHRHRIGRAGVFIGLENYQFLLGRQRLLARGLQHAPLHGRRLVVKFALGLWLALLLNQHLPFKALLPRHRAAALDRADGAVGDRLLVDLRRAVLDHLLGADASSG